MNNNIEKISCSAIWYKDLKLKKVFTSNVLPINCDRGIVFCGHRHCQCMYSMCSITGLRSVETEVGKYVQGFLTTKNRFVDREEGAKIALGSGQIEKLNYSSKTLYSEDLY